MANILKFDANNLNSTDITSLYHIKRNEIINITNDNGLIEIEYTFANKYSQTINITNNIEINNYGITLKYEWPIIINQCEQLLQFIEKYIPHLYRFSQNYEILGKCLITDMFEGYSVVDKLNSFQKICKTINDNLNHLQIIELCILMIAFYNQTPTIPDFKLSSVCCNHIKKLVEQNLTLDQIYNLCQESDKSIFYLNFNSGCGLSVNDYMYYHNLLFRHSSGFIYFKTGVDFQMLEYIRLNYS